MNKETQALEKTPLILSLFISILVLLLHFAYLFTDFQQVFVVKSMQFFIKTGLFEYHFKPHLFALLMGGLYAIGVKSIKSERITSERVLFCLCFGGLLFFGAYFTLVLPDACLLYTSPSPRDS